MKKTDVLKYFGGGSKVAEALSISPGAVSQWPEDLPALRQLQIEEITGGELKAAREARPIKRVA